MEYREFGKTGEKLSILGFGAMRLPVLDDDNGKINYPEAIKMVRHAIDNGVNYLDTAYPYHKRTSEAFCAAALKDGYREKVKLATKLPSWSVNEHDDMMKYLDEQLKILEVNQIDFYLLHNLNTKFWETYKKCDYKSFIEEAKKSGKIKYMGFSFHDNLDLFKEIVDDYPWDFCQIQLNYLDEEYQAGLEGLKYAHERGLGVIIMEPLRGGALAGGDNLPDDIKALWDSAETKHTPVEWALKYLWDKEEISVVLSGMSAMEHVEENLATASDSEVNSLTDNERALIKKVSDIYQNRMPVNCTKCRYCMPCPQEVDIPGNFWVYNHSAMFNDFDGAKKLLGWIGKDASNCIQCGICESKCPQNIEIVKHLADMVEVFDL